MNNGFYRCSSNPSPSVDVKGPEKLPAITLVTAYCQLIGLHTGCLGQKFA